jgi:hypothetical protein
LLASVRVNRIIRFNQTNKSFLFLFFKKEILPCLSRVQPQKKLVIDRAPPQRRAWQSPETGVMQVVSARLRGRLLQG